jgi:hypothetical protein
MGRSPTHSPIAPHIETAKRSISETVHSPPAEAPSRAACYGSGKPRRVCPTFGTSLCQAAGIREVPNVLQFLTAETVESPLRRDPHGGFGERPGETDREQPRHRAPGRLNSPRPGSMWPALPEIGPSAARPGQVTGRSPHLEDLPYRRRGRWCVPGRRAHRRSGDPPMSDCPAPYPLQRDGRLVASRGIACGLTPKLPGCLSRSKSRRHGNVTHTNVRAGVVTGRGVTGRL